MKAKMPCRRFTAGVSVLGLCLVLLSGCGGGQGAEESAKSGQDRGNMMQESMKSGGRMDPDAMKKKMMEGKK